MAYPIFLSRSHGFDQRGQMTITMFLAAVSIQALLPRWAQRWLVEFSLMDLLSKQTHKQRISISKTDLSTHISSYIYSYINYIYIHTYILVIHIYILILFIFVLKYRYVLCYSIRSGWIFGILPSPKVARPSKTSAPRWDLTHDQLTGAESRRWLSNGWNLRWFQWLSNGWSNGWSHGWSWFSGTWGEFFWWISRFLGLLR